MCQCSCIVSIHYVLQVITAIVLCQLCTWAQITLDRQKIYIEIYRNINLKKKLPVKLFLQSAKVTNRELFKHTRKKHDLRFISLSPFYVNE